MFAYQVWECTTSDPAKMPAILEDRWRKGFGYIVEQKIAPVLVGEFGGRNVGLDTTEGRWQRQFADYLGQTGISWAYWALNPNSKAFRSWAVTLKL